MRRVAGEPAQLGLLINGGGGGGQELHFCEAGREEDTEPASGAQPLGPQPRPLGAANFLPGSLSLQHREQHLLPSPPVLLSGNPNIHEDENQVFNSVNFPRP